VHVFGSAFPIFLHGGWDSTNLNLIARWNPNTKPPPLISGPSHPQVYAPSLTIIRINNKFKTHSFSIHHYTLLISTITIILLF